MTGNIRANLQTARLALRPLLAEDEAAVVAALNDIAVTGWLSVVPFPYFAQDFKTFRADVAKPGEDFAVVDDQGMAGIVSLGFDDHTLGYWFAPRAHGKGYATEAARAVVDAHLAHGPVDLISGYFEGNHRSANVLRKLGFVETGRAPKFCRALGHDRLHIDMRRAGGQHG